MAIGDAYATEVQYRDAISKTDAGEDPEILVDLKAVSRHLDRVLGQFFTKDAAAVARLFDGDGTSQLCLDSDLCPGIADLTGLTVKVDRNADYDVADSGETLAINTDFWVGPWEAAEGPEPKPYTFLEIVPTSSVLSAWPKQQRAAEVTAIFGWPAVPKAIERAAIHLTAILRLESPRATSRIAEGLDQFIATSRPGQAIIGDLKAQYRRWVVA